MSESPFGFARPEDSPGFLLWQTTVTWQRLIKAALEPYEISHSQFVIMALLLWFEINRYDTTQVLIVTWSKLDKMTVSASLKKLVALEFVTRTEHAVDTRAKRVALTSKGKGLILKLIPLVEKVDEDFFTQIPDEDQQSLKRILKMLLQKENEFLKAIHSLT